jgi:hypothetical protein
MTSGVARAAGAAMTADAARAADTAEALDASLTRSELSAPDIQDREKFDRMLEFGHALPRVRTTSEQHLRGRELSRERVLAAAVRLIDLGFFRSGSDEYAADNGTFGLATIRREHVTCHKDEITFEYVGKSGKRHLQDVADDPASPVVRSLKRRRSFPDCDDLPVSAVGGDGTTSRPGTSTTICGTYPAATSPPGLPHPARDRARRRRARRLAGGRIADRAQTRHHPRRPGGGRIPGKHSRRGPHVLHRRPCHRPLLGRHHDRVVPGRSG